MVSSLPTEDRYTRLVSAIHDVLAGKEVFDSIPVDSPSPILRAGFRDRIWVTHLYMPVYEKHCAEMIRILLDDFGKLTPYSGERVTIDSNINILDENELRRFEDMIVVITVMRRMILNMPAFGLIRPSQLSPTYPHMVEFIARYRLVARQMFY